MIQILILNPSLAEQDMPLANSVDTYQLVSEEANWSVSALFIIKYVSFYQKPGLSYLIGWKLEVGMASGFIQQGKDQWQTILIWTYTVCKGSA